MRDRIFDVVVWTLIAGFGLVTAYVTFGLLSSQASTEVQGYSVEGALAGFVVSAGVLTSIYLQVRRSSDEVGKLRDRNQELQQKLLRGAPRPEGFDTEVAERQKIVLARPEGWRPFGGIIFDYQLPPDELDMRDHFPPQFRLTYQPIEEGKNRSKRRLDHSDHHQTEYYSNLQENLEEQIDDIRDAVWDKYSLWESYSCEYVYLGGETQPIRSLKFIVHEYAHVEILPPDRMHSQSLVRWKPITKQQYEAGVTDSQVHRVVKHEDNVEPRPHSFYTRIMYVLVVCYCEQLKMIYHFHFWDDLDNFVESSERFNQVLDSVRFLT